MQSKFLKIRFALLFSFFAFHFSFSQTNLVPNPSFEMHDTCPNSAAQIIYSTPWIVPTTGTPDYYNACYDTITLGDNLFSVPKNYFGYQPTVTGNAYGGFFAWYTYFSTFREYVQANLTTTLMANQKYYVTIYVSLGDSSRIATDDIGIYFSQTAINRTDFDAFGYTPQISNPNGNILSDKINWMKISGSFIAQGNEQYITIGNFKPDTNTDTVNVMPYLSANSDYNAAYYYLDDVCISSDSLICNPSIGIKSVKDNSMTWYYDSFNKKVIIKENGSYVLSIVTIVGNKKEIELQGNQQIDISFLPEGYYILTLSNQQGFTTKKIILNH